MSSMEHIPTACNKVDDDIGDWMMMIIKIMMIMMMIMVLKKKMMIMIARIRMIVMIKMIMTMLIIIVMMNKEMLNIVITEVMRAVDDDVDDINDDALDYQPSILLDR